MTDILARISRFADLKIGASEKLRRQLFDHEADGIRRARKAFVAKLPAPETETFGREQLSLLIVIEQLGFGRIVECASAQCPSRAASIPTITECFV